jgi:hypothetical protein
MIGPKFGEVYETGRESFLFLLSPAQAREFALLVCPELAAQQTKVA